MAKPTIDPTTNKPLPIPSNTTRSARPGTSSTEAALKTNLRSASNAFKRAERAERSYIAKKKAAAARTSTQEAKEHFKIAKKELGLGLRKLWGAVRDSKFLVLERRERKRREREERMLVAQEEKRRRWEERRVEIEGRLGVDGGVVGAGEGDEEKEKEKGKK